MHLINLAGFTGDRGAQKLFTHWQVRKVNQGRIFSIKEEDYHEQ